MHATETIPRIWIGCLAAYNQGILHGEWVDAAQDADDLESIAKEILSRSPVPGAEEFFIADSEGFGALPIGDYTPLSDVSLLAQMIEEIGDPFIAFVGLRGLSYLLTPKTDLSTLRAQFEEAYLGEYEDAESYAEELHSFRVQALVQEEKRFPGSFSLLSYVDWTRIARDMETNGDVSFVNAPGNGVYVFSNH